MFDVADRYRGGFAKVKQDDKYFFLDTKGINSFSMIFEDASSFYVYGATVRHNGKYSLLDRLGKLYDFNDKLKFYNVDYLPYCSIKQKYSEEVTILDFCSEFGFKLFRTIKFDDIEHSTDFRIEVIIDSSGYCVDYNIINDMNDILKDNAFQIINDLSEYTQPAIKDGKKVAVKLDFSALLEIFPGGISMGTDLHSITEIEIIDKEELD